MANYLGEYDKLRVLLRLIELRDEHNEIVLDKTPVSIHTVGLVNEYGSLPNCLDLRKLKYPEIEGLAKDVGAFRTKNPFKSDVIINGEGYIIRTERLSPPRLVHHLPRWGWFRVCEQLGLNISLLDDMVNDYYDLLYQGKIKEEIYNYNRLSPFAEQKEYLLPLLSYFYFSGTGTKDSDFPAKYVLQCKDPFDISKWKIYDKTAYLEHNWNFIKFSMCSKGFEAYPYTDRRNAWKTALSKPWAKIINGQERGALDVSISYLFFPEYRGIQG